MKKHIFLFFLCSLNFVSRSQNLDSLLGVWEDTSQHDSIRVISYKDYIWNGFLFKQPKKAVDMAEELHAFAKKYEYPLASATGFNLQGIGNAIQGNYSNALEFYEKALTIQEKMGDKKGVSASLNNIGNIYKDQGNYPLALEYIKKSLDVNEALGNKNGVASSLGNIGAIYHIQGNYPSALEYYQKSLIIFENLGDKKGISINTGNIGVIYWNQKNYSSALEYYQKSLAIKEELGDKKGVAIVMSNIGNIQYDQGSFSEALEYYQKSLTTREEIGDKNGIAASLSNIGLIYKEQKKYDLALDYYQESLKLKEELGDKKGIASSLGNIGALFQEQNNHNLAIEYCQKGFRLAKEIGALEWQGKACDCLYKSYKNLGKSTEALNYFEQMIELRDSMFNEENTKKLTQLEMQYEFDKQKVADSISNAEAEKIHLANLEAEKAKGAQQKTEIAAQKKQNIFLFIGLGLVAFFGFFMYNRYKVTKKQKGIIEEKEKETSFQKEIIEEKHREITDSINYAERIQRSFLASNDILDRHLKDYFVFFKPKDVVSGDFYWASHLNNGQFVFCCADSTGHGVPGAIMSILNISSLEKAIEKEYEPHLILNKTRELIIERLKKDGSTDGGKDGMDCSLLVLNQDKTQLSFASAHNPVFIIRNNELLEFKGDKIPVGKHQRDEESFTLQKITLYKDDVVYTLTDGMSDQFGGDKGKKYMVKNLKKFFLAIAHLPMKEQHSKLEEEFTNWKGENEQVDDVCVIGVRL